VGRGLRDGLPMQLFVVVVVVVVASSCSSKPIRRFCHRYDKTFHADGSGIWQQQQ